MILIKKNYMCILYDDACCFKCWNFMYTSSPKFDRILWNEIDFA